jgi:hypothetical protein
MTITFGRSIAGVLAFVGALAPLACSGSASAVPGRESTGEDQSLLQEGACFTEALGGPTSCKPIDTWKAYADQACESRGLGLGDFAVGAACDGGFVEAKYACCKQAPQPIPIDPGGDPVAACFGDAQGGPTSCKPAEEWTRFASELCTRKGSAIAHIAFAEECAPGSFRWTKYECCDSSAPPPPPPPPPTCSTTLLGDERSCKPYGAWKEYAFDYCARQKQTLTDLSFGASCGGDLARAAKVTCCTSPEPLPYPPPPPPDPVPPSKEPPPEPPPQPLPPPDACTGSGGGGTSCVGTSAWKLSASEDCAKQGLHLTELYFGRTCANGAYEAKWTCCK